MFIWLKQYTCKQIIACVQRNPLPISLWNLPSVFASRCLTCVSLYVCGGSVLMCDYIINIKILVETYLAPIQWKTCDSNLSRLSELTRVTGDDKQLNREETLKDRHRSPDSRNREE